VSSERSELSPEVQWSLELGPGRWSWSHCTTYKKNVWISSSASLWSLSLKLQPAEQRSLNVVVSRNNVILTCQTGCWWSEGIVTMIRFIFHPQICVLFIREVEKLNFQFSLHLCGNI